MKEERTLSDIGKEIQLYIEMERGISLLCGIEIGRRLVEAKEMLKHGEWLPWLKQEANMSARKAQYYMKIYKGFGEEAENVPNSWMFMPISKAYALLKVPQEKWEAFAQEIDINKESSRELEKRINETYAKAEKPETAEEVESQTDFESCPFCGSEEIHIRETVYGNYANVWWFAGCDVCGARTRGFRSPGQAAAAWNRRKDYE